MDKNYVQLKKFDGTFMYPKTVIDQVDGLSDKLLGYSMKDLVESQVSTRIESNSAYTMTVYGQEVRVAIIDKDQQIASTSGTGLISLVRHLVSGGANVATTVADTKDPSEDPYKIVITYNDNDYEFVNSGMYDDTHSIASVTFNSLLIAMNPTTGTQADLIGKSMTMTLTNVEHGVSQVYKVSIVESVDASDLSYDFSSDTTEIVKDKSLVDAILSLASEIEAIKKKNEEQDDVDESSVYYNELDDNSSSEESSSEESATPAE